MSDKYELIAAERATHSSENSGDAPTMVRMCAWIGVSKSGYYEWLDRRPSAAARRRELLADKIRALFEAFGGTYGYLTGPDSPHVMASIAASTPNSSAPASMSAPSWSVG